MMSKSIKEIIFSTCKNILGSKIRNDIKNQLHVLDRDESGMLAYLARQQNLQFLSYLIIDRDRESYQNLPRPLLINQLSEAQKKYIEIGNDVICRVNAFCLSSLQQINPDLIGLIDPYDEFTYKGSHKAPKKIFTEIINEIDLKETFNDHPGLTIIKRSLRAISNINSQQFQASLRDSIKTIMKNIHTSGIKNVPEDISRFPLSARRDSPEFHIANLLFGLVALKTSLFVIDQMIFSAFNIDKLPVLDNDNVFSIKHNGHNALGEYLITESQPTGSELFASPGDIIFVDLVREDHTINGPFLIENKKMSLGSEYGEKIQFDMRKLDSTLNPFFGLVKYMD